MGDVEGWVDSSFHVLVPLEIYRGDGKEAASYCSGSRV